LQHRGVELPGADLADSPPTRHQYATG